MPIQISSSGGSTHIGETGGTTVRIEPTGLVMLDGQAAFELIGSGSPSITSVTGYAISADNVAYLARTQGIAAATYTSVDSSTTVTELTATVPSYAKRITIAYTGNLSPGTSNRWLITMTSGSTTVGSAGSVTRCVGSGASTMQWNTTTPGIDLTTTTTGAVPWAGTAVIDLLESTATYNRYSAMSSLAGLTTTAETQTSAGTVTLVGTLDTNITITLRKVVLGSFNTASLQVYWEG